MQETQETQAWSLGWEDPLEKEMATNSSFLAWEISHGQRSLGGYSPRGCKTVRHDLVTEQQHPCTKEAQLWRPTQWVWELGLSAGSKTSQGHILSNSSLLGFRLVRQPGLSCNCWTTLPLWTLLCRAPYKQPWLLWCPVPAITLRMCRHFTARLGWRCQHQPHGTDEAPTPSPSGASSSHSGETCTTRTNRRTNRRNVSSCWARLRVVSGSQAPPLHCPATWLSPLQFPWAATPLPLPASLPKAEAAETQREMHLHGIPGTIQRTFQNVPALRDSPSELPFLESHFLFLLKCLNTTESSYLWARKTQILGSQINPTWRIQSQLRLPLCWEKPPGGAPPPEICTQLPDASRDSDEWKPGRTWTLDFSDGNWEKAWVWG